MSKNEDALLARIQNNEKLTAKDELSSGYKGELRRLMVTFVDSELAGAAGFVDIINKAPGIRERRAAARIVSEKFEHAHRILEMLEDFGVNTDLYVQSHPWDARLSRTLDLGNRRISGDKRLNVLHYPYEGWLDSVVMNMLMGLASSIQLEEISHCSYAPLAAAMGEIAAVEAEHAELGRKGLAKAIENGYSLEAAQASVDYWYSRVAATFGKSDSQHFDQGKAYGLRRTPNADLLAKWESRIAEQLARIGLEARD
ncbi:Phenylacetic acid catabolic protein [Terasakiella sp. SH-1]|uniref:Phenylacetic acid catabolic protein n=1 Tax=Terasakiella sp. SH-1 TaxID=2560057 RepID=UPI001074165C|nr:Phenylacetic acid catabolic protein [Terasakiella sp. SH-1]